MTKDEAREAAWWRYVNRCTKVTFSATFYEGFDAGYEAAEAALRERIIAELEDIMQGGEEWRRYDEALREAVKIVKGGEDATN